ASCTVRPKLDAGTSKTTVTRNGTTSTVSIAFTACGQYTVTRSCSRSTRLHQPRGRRAIAGLCVSSGSGAAYRARRSEDRNDAGRSRPAGRLYRVRRDGHRPDQAILSTGLRVAVRGLRTRLHELPGRPPERRLHEGRARPARQSAGGDLRRRFGRRRGEG